MTISIKFQSDPTPAFREFLNAHFRDLEAKIMDLQVALDTLKTAVATLTDDVANVATDVAAVLVKLASAPNITPEQHAQLDAAVEALQGQVTAVEAVDTQLKTVLP